MYWTKTVWPAVLSIKYSIHTIRLATGVIDAQVLAGLAALAALAAASVWRWRRGDPTIALLSAAMIASYLPTSNAVVLMQVFFAERIWYLPSLFVALIAGLVLGRLIRGRLPLTVAVLVASAMTARCWLRNAEWRDNGTLYAVAAADQPDGAAAIQLYGQWLVTQGRPREALPLLQRAVEIDPGFTDAHRALGQAYRQIGQLQAAVREFQIADMQAPGHPPTQAALAELAQQLLEGDETLPKLREAADASPNDVEAELRLVRHLRHLGLAGQALRRLEATEARFRDNPEFQAEHAVVLVYLDRRDEAIARYWRSLERDPDHGQRMVELAMLLLERRQGNDLDDAWRLSARALELAPDAPASLACRAELVAFRGDLPGAIELYRRAIAQLPPDTPQRRIFVERAQALGLRP
jgi:tetratricopeptide (TPR) repeat protein